jgi:hypothetical protein
MIENLKQQVIAWNQVHGIESSIERQRFLVDCEVKEFHEATGEAKLFELGDWFFTAYLQMYDFSTSFVA